MPLELVFLFLILVKANAGTSSVSIYMENKRGKFQAVAFFSRLALSAWSPRCESPDSMKSKGEVGGSNATYFKDSALLVLVCMS